MVKELSSMHTSVRLTLLRAGRALLLLLEVPSSSVFEERFPSRLIMLS